MKRPETWSAARSGASAREAGEFSVPVAQVARQPSPQPAKRVRRAKPASPEVKPPGQKKPFGNWRKAGTERNDSLADPCCRHRDAASIRISTSRWTEQRYSTSLPLLSNLHPLRQRTGSDSERAQVPGSVRRTIWRTQPRRFRAKACLVSARARLRYRTRDRRYLVLTRCRL